MKNQAGEGRNASTVADRFHDRAGELEAAARAEELHEVALTEARARLVLAAIERGYADLSLPWPREFVRELLRRWPAPVDAEIVERAREEVRRAIRAEFRAEAEEARLARPALPPGEPTPDKPQGAEVVDAEVIEDPSPAEVDDDGLPPWSALPEDWQARYSGDREVGRSEWSNELVRQRSSDGASSRGLSTWDVDQFRHPGLRGR